MLWEASVDDSVVLVISVHNDRFEPLIWLVTDEALSWLKVTWAVHLSMGAEMGSKGVILSHCVLHKASSVVHMGEDDLTTSPSVMGEGRLLNVHYLEPGAQKVLLIELLGKWWHYIANNLLGSDGR